MLKVDRFNLALISTAKTTRKKRPAKGSLPAPAVATLPRKKKRVGAASSQVRRSFDYGRGLGELILCRFSRSHSPTK